MPTATGRTFKSGNSEALRLPKDLAFGIGVELTLVKAGDVLTITPTPRPRLSPRELVEALRSLPRPSSVDFIDKDEFPPEREGL